MAKNQGVFYNTVHNDQNQQAKYSISNLESYLKLQQCINIKNG